MIHRIPNEVINRTRMQRPGRRLSLLAVQEEIPLPNHQGAVGVRRLKILRLEQAVILPEHSTAPHSLFREPILAPPVAEANPQSQARVILQTTQPETKTPEPEKHRDYRKVFAEPGIRLRIPFGQVNHELAAQLKQPERLKDDDPVECYAQIYEAQCTMPVARIAAAELGDGALQSQLHPLTRDRAERLGAPQLFKPTRYPFETRASTRQIYAGQRVYRLWPVFDPTEERKENPAGQNAASQESSRRDGSARTTKPDHSETRNPNSAFSIPRRQIPRSYLNPMQFKYSREEVLYDMKSALGTLPPESGALTRWLFIYPLRLLKVLATALVSRGRMKKWRAMLKGKTLDEQLWTVTPPRGFSYHPTVRRWAEETLARAGYDPQPTLVEWEIFWRRRGWN
jgi:hypothetical protein